MAFVSFLIAFVMFLIAAMSGEGWLFDTLSWNPTAWGLVFLSLGFLLPGAISTYRTRSLPQE